MGKVKNIGAYKADDGTIFEDACSAIEYQKELDIRARIDAFVNQHCWSSMTRQDVSDLIYENKNQLQKCLK